MAPGIVVTDGPNGAYVRLRGEHRHVKACATEVIDTVGAGDMFAGVVIGELVMKRPLDDILDRASELSAQVVAQHGARLRTFPALDWDT